MVRVPRRWNARGALRLLDAVRTVENFLEEELESFVGKLVGDPDDSSTVANLLQHQLDFSISLHDDPPRTEAPSENRRSQNFYR